VRATWPYPARMEPRSPLSDLKLRWGRSRRAFRAFFRLPGTKRFVAGLVVLLLVLVLATVLIDVRYRDPSADGAELGFPESLYAVFTMLFFGSAYPLPTDPLTRVVFFVVPVVGLVVIGQFLARLAAAYVNRERWIRAVASTYDGHVIVCGMGRVGFRVVRWLLDLGAEVVVIESIPTNPFIDQIRAWGVPVIIADARRPEVLTDAGVMTCSAICPITGDDLVNLAMATEARALRSDLKVVLRTFDERLGANLQAGFDIHTAFSAAALAAPAFAAAAMLVPVDYALAFGEGAARTLLSVTKFTLVEGSSLVGSTVGGLEDDYGVFVIAHRTTEFIFNPPSEAVLEVGQGFVVAGTTEALSRLGQLTPPTRELRRYHEGRWSIET